MTVASIIAQRPDVSSISVSHGDDEDLLLRYRNAHDTAAFEQLVHRYEGELYTYLRRYLGDAEMAEDVFQATFLQVHRKCHQFQEGRAFRPWLYSIATHMAIDALRKERKHPKVSFDAKPSSSDEPDIDRNTFVQILANHGPGPVDQLEEQERRAWARRAVQELPLPLRSAVLLVYYQGLKYREVAEILGIPVGTLKSRIHAALVRLNLAWRKKHRGE